MTDIPRPAPGDPDWIDWADDEEATGDQVHAATAAATPSTLVKRDAAGRFAAVNGTAAGDVVTKSQLDGKANTAHTHGVADLTATGTRDATTILYGDNTWKTAPAGGTPADATTTSKGVVQLAGDLAGTAAAPTVPGLANRAPTTRLINTTAPLTGGGDLSADRTLAVSAATETAAGVVELATVAETTTGTDTVRAVHPAGVKAVGDTKLGIVSGSGLTDAHKVTQAAYDAIATPRPAGRVYFIVG